MLTVRQREILRILHQTGQTIPIQELSRVLQISSRTLRYDLKDISYALKSQNLKISIIPSQGVRVEDVKNPKWQMLFEKDVVQNQQIRIFTLLYHLLLSDKVSIGSMASKFHMNRQTITRDIGALIDSGVLKNEDILRSTHGLHCTLDHTSRLETFCQWSMKSEFLSVAIQEAEKNFNEEDNKVQAWIDHIESSAKVEFEEFSRKHLRAVATFANVRSTMGRLKSSVFNEIFDSKRFGLIWDAESYRQIEVSLANARLNKG